MSLLESSYFQQRGLEEKLNNTLYPTDISNWTELLNKKIIDIGCGHLWGSFRCSNHDKIIENNDVISVDYDDVNPSLSNLLKADAYHLPFISSYFDYAILSRVCSSDTSLKNILSEKIRRHFFKPILMPTYSEDLPRILKEVNRILKKDGFVYLEVNTGWLDYDKRNDVKTKYIKFLKKYGFKIVVSSLLDDLYIIAKKVN